MRHIVLPACQSALSDSLCSCSRLVCTCLPHARLSRRPRLHDCELRARLLSRRVHLLLRGPTYRHVHRWMSRHRRLGCGRECHLPLLLLCCGRCCCCCCYYCIAAAAVAVAVLRGHCPLSLCCGRCRWAATTIAGLLLLLRIFFLSRGGNPPDPPLQTWLAGSGHPGASHPESPGQANNFPSQAVWVRHSSEGGPPFE